MTPSEMQAALDRMDDAAFLAFKSRFGGDYATRAQYVQHLVDAPAHEGKLAFLLGLQTESEKFRIAAELSAAVAEKSASASDRSAQAAESGARSARWAMIWAALAVAAAIAALTYEIYGKR